jgi:hypothetical protein
MVDALLVFNPLQEICFFVLRAPHLDQMGVTPLLRRRLFGLQRLYKNPYEPLYYLCWFSKHVSSFRLLPLRDLLRLPCGSRFSSLIICFASRLAVRASLLISASYAPSLRAYLRAFGFLRV